MLNIIAYRRKVTWKSISGQEILINQAIFRRYFQVSIVILRNLRGEMRFSSLNFQIFHNHTNQCYSLT